MGSQSRPYLVQEALVTGISAFFKRAINHETSFGSEPGVLRFPEDDQIAWEMLLHWRLKGYAVKTYVSEHTEEQLQLVRFWVLAEKYDIKEFQNVIMNQIFDALDQRTVELETVKLAFESTPPGSPLRTLMAEETVLHMDLRDEYEHADLRELDGVLGFTTELMYALDRKKSAQPLGVQHDEDKFKKRFFVVRPLEEIRAED